MFFKFIGGGFLWASVVFNVLPFEGLFGVVVVSKCQLTILVRLVVSSDDETHITIFQMRCAND